MHRLLRDSWKCCGYNNNDHFCQGCQWLHFLILSSEFIALTDHSTWCEAHLWRGYPALQVRIWIFFFLMNTEITYYIVHIHSWMSNPLFTYSRIKCEVVSWICCIGWYVMTQYLEHQPQLFMYKKKKEKKKSGWLVMESFCHVLLDLLHKYIRIVI